VTPRTGGLPVKNLETSCNAGQSDLEMSPPSLPKRSEACRNHERIKQRCGLCAKPWRCVRPPFGERKEGEQGQNVALLLPIARGRDAKSAEDLIIAHKADDRVWLCEVLR
jgi:hypothetical protein